MIKAKMKVLIFLEVGAKKWKVAHKNNGRDPQIATEIEKSVFLILKSCLKKVVVITKS